MKHILLSNDDGFDAKGLLALKEALKEIAYITVVAPASQKSACGHSLTLTKPLRFIKVDEGYYKLEDGTPTDCIYLALCTLFKDKKPDLIISGINYGSNMGEDITYSGTAAAAMEGAIYGIASIAISQVINGQSADDIDYTYASSIIKDLVNKIFEGIFPLNDREFLNVNIPYKKNIDSKKYKITYAGYRIYGSGADMHKNPRGEEHYWLGLHPLKWKKREGITAMSDFDATKEGYVSLTPIKVDLSVYERLERLEKWIN
jgi:5'-nucleotidase